jgi:signal transduction histidine kinase
MFLAGYRIVAGVAGWILIATVLVYAVYKLLYPFYAFSHKSITYLDLYFDIGSCLALPFFTGGISSPFLLYLYLPVLTSALFYPKKYTISAAVLQLMAIFVSQVWVHGGNLHLAFTPVDHPTYLFIIYPLVSILMTLLPYLTNLNMADSIRTEAIRSERKRLSRDMHDGLAQSLSVISWRLQLLWNSIAADEKMPALNQLTELMDLVNGAQGEARAAIDQLQTSPASNHGLPSNLAQQASDFTRNFGIKCELRMADGHLELSPLAELQLLCVTQEVFNNIRKHAQATAVAVDLKSEGNQTVITIADNGRGFDSALRQNGHGLSIMAERVTSVGGQFAIQSRPGSGTTIQIEFPSKQKGF